MAIFKSKKSLHGIFVPHHKNTKDLATIVFDQIDEVCIPMQQHMGAPCIPAVKVGDHVYMGQKIGDNDQFFSVPIHASCSGDVIRIEDYQTVNGAKTKLIVIKNDGKFELSSEIAKPEVTDHDSFLRAVRESGLVGLGGAGFPVHVKLGYKDVAILDKLVINAAECEPYITSDYRECMENLDHVLSGIAAVQKHLNIKDVYFGIEANKPEAIRMVDERTASNPHFHVVQLKQIYPQGAEKSIIYATTGITVAAGKLPADCGVIVMNVSSVGFLGKYLEDGIPLISKRITVDGDCIQNPNNLIVPIGTPISDVLAYCGVDGNQRKVLMGGPMMGLPVTNLSSPVIKNNNAVLAFHRNEIRDKDTTSCIRCGGCVSVCPMNLMPTLLEKNYRDKNADELNRLGINLCINCGCCSYTCPAKRPLAQTNQLAKQFVRNQK